MTRKIGSGKHIMITGYFVGAVVMAMASAIYFTLSELDKRVDPHFDFVDVVAAVCLAFCCGTLWPIALIVVVTAKLRGTHAKGSHEHPCDC